MRSRLGVSKLLDTTSTHCVLYISLMYNLSRSVPDHPSVIIGTHTVLLQKLNDGFDEIKHSITNFVPDE